MSRRSSAIALLAAVFFAGAATTLAVLRVVEQRGSGPRELQHRAFWRGEAPPGWADRLPGVRGASPFMELARTRVTEHMTEALGLTDQQRSRIEDALEDRRVATQEAMNRILPGLRSQMDSVNAEIEAILTPEQRTAFQAYLRDDRARLGRGGRQPSQRGKRRR